VFLYGFAKNERENISNAERKALLKLGDEYMKLSMASAVTVLKEIERDE
jgi:hypothetical protein